MGGLKLLRLNSICCSVPAAASRRPRAALPLLRPRVVLTQARCNFAPAAARPARSSRRRETPNGHNGPNRLPPPPPQSPSAPLRAGSPELGFEGLRGGRPVAGRFPFLKYVFLSSVTRKHAGIPAPLSSSVPRSPKRWKALAGKVLIISAACAQEVLKGHVYLSLNDYVLENRSRSSCNSLSSVCFCLCQLWGADETAVTVSQHKLLGLNYRGKDAGSGCAILYLKVLRKPEFCQFKLIKKRNSADD